MVPEVYETGQLRRIHRLCPCLFTSEIKLRVRDFRVRSHVTVEAQSGRNAAELDCRCM